MKTCTKCSEVKEPTEFYKRSRSPDGREAWCKVCRLAHNRRRWEKNLDSHRELTRCWYQKNREAHLASSKSRYEADKSYALAKYYKRETRTKLATPKWADHKAIARAYKFARCLSEFVGLKYEVDHIVPLQGKTVCGLHVQGNLQVILASINKSKFNTVWPDQP